MCKSALTDARTFWGLILSEANILRHSAHCDLLITHVCTGEAEGEMCLKIYFLVFALLVVVFHVH